MAAAEVVGLAVAGVRPVARGVKVPVVGVVVDELIDVRVGVDGVRADEVRSGDAVPEVAVDGVDEEQGAVHVSGEAVTENHQ